MPGLAPDPTTPIHRLSPFLLSASGCVRASVSHPYPQRPFGPHRAADAPMTSVTDRPRSPPARPATVLRCSRVPPWDRSEEHTSELQSLMRISYAVFCLKKKKKTRHTHQTPKTLEAKTLNRPVKEQM